MAVLKEPPGGGSDQSDDLIVLTREKIQATLDHAAELGRVTRGTANELMSELLRLGRQQTDALFSELADRTGLRSHPSFPIEDYEQLTVAQVLPRLEGLNGMQLLQVQEFERKHGNRKSVLGALEKALA